MPSHNLHVQLLRTSLPLLLRWVCCVGDATQVSKCCWLAARVMLCSKSDKELREQLFEATAKDGLLGPKLSAAQAAAAWVRLWLASSEVERETLLMLLTARTRLQARVCAGCRTGRGLSTGGGVSCG